MMRAVGVFAVGLVLVWVIAHVFYLGPVKDATEMALVWTVWVTVAASVVASLTVLAFGLMAGGSRPAWLRFVQSARTVAAVIGCGLIVVGLLHYRDTEPSGEIHWIIRASRFSSAPVSSTSGSSAPTAAPSESQPSPRGSRREDSKRVEDAVDAVRWLRDRRSAFGGGWRG